MKRQRVLSAAHLAAIFFHRIANELHIEFSAIPLLLYATAIAGDLLH